METFSITRLTFDKTVVNSGQLSLNFEENQIYLHFVDNDFDVKSNDLFTIVALEKLRLQLEARGFLINCNGCRFDASYRAAGTQVGLKTYLITNGHQATQIVDIFEPTLEFDKICTVREHKERYKEWLESL